MPRPSYSDDQLILAARLYLLDGLPQGQVAKMINVSQAKVSRMLALARERGLVRITVAEYQPRDLALEEELGRALRIEAIVIRSVPGLPMTDLRQMVGYFAAAPVLDWLESANTVAVAGGRTMQVLAEHLKPLRGQQRPLEIVQAMGTIDSTPGPYDAVELGRALARRLKGTFARLNAPAILPDAETCAQLLRLEQIRQVMGRLAEADLALVGVGTLENSVFMERGAIDGSGLATLRGAGAVGEILGRFYDRSGVECATPFRDRVVGLDLDGLKKVAKRVGIVAGADRAVAILAAIRGGLLNAIVIDESGAKALLGAMR